jgi:hypothetical protein
VCVCVCVSQHKYTTLMLLHYCYLDV